MDPFHENPMVDVERQSFATEPKPLECRPNFK